MRTTRGTRSTPRLRAVWPGFDSKQSIFGLIAEPRRNDSADLVPLDLVTTPKDPHTWGYPKP